MKRTVALFTALALTLLIFSSCGYRIALVKKEKETDETTTTDTVPFVAPSTEEITTQETTLPETTLDEAAANGIEIEENFKTVVMDTASVLKFYTETMNNVKVRCPGFVKSEYQDITDVTAGNGDINLANRIVNLVSKELLKDSGTTSSSVKVAAHDDVAVLDNFPVFGKEYGCNLTDLSVIKSASCYTDGNVYKIVILFNDQLNPEPGESQFGEIMTPIARKNIASGIADYLVVLDLSKYQFDFNYTGCELTCYVDMQNGRLISLSQKMIIDINIDLDLDLIFFKTNVIKAKGRLINHLDYKDFDWST